MLKKKLTTQRGFTLISLMIATALVVIPILAIGVVLVDCQRAWQAMYNRTFSGVATDSYVARRTFDAVIRKASREKLLLDDAGNWVEIYYYQDANSTAIDRYVCFRFYKAYSQLIAEYGKLNPKATLATQTICGNVSKCVFKGTGRSAQMILTLDDGSRTVTVASSAVMHNQ